MPPLKRPDVTNTIILPPRHAIMAAETDILVVGGGPAGLGAALGAAQAGANVIVSERYGQKAFNLHVDERTPVMDALFHGQPFDTTGRSESVQNLLQRYQDVDAAFPDELRADAEAPPAHEASGAG